MHTLRNNIKLIRHYLKFPISEQSLIVRLIV